MQPNRLSFLFRAVLQPVVQFVRLKKSAQIMTFRALPISIVSHYQQGLISTFTLVTFYSVGTIMQLVKNMSPKPPIVRTNIPFHYLLQHTRILQMLHSLVVTQVCLIQKHLGQRNLTPQNLELQDFCDFDSAQLLHH